MVGAENAVWRYDERGVSPSDVNGAPSLYSWPCCDSLTSSHHILVPAIQRRSIAYHAYHLTVACILLTVLCFHSQIRETSLPQRNFCAQLQGSPETALTPCEKLGYYLLSGPQFTKSKLSALHAFVFFGIAKVLSDLKHLCLLFRLLQPFAPCACWWEQGSYLVVSSFWTFLVSLSSSDILLKTNVSLLVTVKLNSQTGLLSMA